MADKSNVEAMVALAEHHAHVEGQGDLEATMAALVAEPVYEWQPMGWVMKGRDLVIRYYEYLISSHIPSTCDVRLVAQWADEIAAASGDR